MSTERLSAEVETVLDRIDEQDVDFLRLQFTDILGTVRDVSIPPGQGLGRQSSSDGAKDRDSLSEIPERIEDAARSTRCGGREANNEHQRVQPKR